MPPQPTSAVACPVAGAESLRRSGVLERKRTGRRLKTAGALRRSRLSCATLFEGRLREAEPSASISTSFGPVLLCRLLPTHSNASIARQGLSGHTPDHATQDRRGGRHPAG